MSAARPLARAARLGLLLVAVVVSLIALPAVPPSADAGVARWTGGIDLYRSGVFTAQKTMLWCTAADVQIIRNIVDHESDHSRASQSTYFAYMRAHNRYAIPLKDGVDMVGWTAGLRHFVDARYRLVESTSFGAALRTAVTNLRRTNLPVALAVANGDHGWVLTGFTATADPAVTSSFRVTSVRVVGPLYGIQSRDGYDMPPDTKLTPAQLQRYWTPWRFESVRMAWNGRIVAVEGIAPAQASAAAAVGSSSAATAQAAPAPAGRAAGSAVTPVGNVAAAGIRGATSPRSLDANVPVQLGADRAPATAARAPVTGLAAVFGPILPAIAGVLLAAALGVLGALAFWRRRGAAGGAADRLAKS